MKFLVFVVVSVACLMVVKSEDTPAQKSDGKVCEPNAEFKKDCNTCKCNEQGTEAACEAKNCAEHKAPEGEKLDDDTACTPGQNFKRKCNDCMCPPSGLKADAACTLISCPAGQ